MCRGTAIGGALRAMLDSLTHVRIAFHAQPGQKPNPPFIEFAEGMRVASACVCYDPDHDWQSSGLMTHLLICCCVAYLTQCAVP